LTDRPSDDPTTGPQPLPADGPNGQPAADSGSATVTADEGAPVLPVAPAAAQVDRRRFFRHFAGEVVHSAATVVGMAGALQRQSMEAATSILSTSGTDALGLGIVPEVANPAAGAAAGFRTAFRWSDDAIYLVDQRRLPTELVEMRCETAGEVAWAIREMVVRGAPAMGQAAAIGLSLTAAKMAGSTPFVRRAAIRGSGTALINARPTAVNVRWAVDRCLAAMDAVGDVDAEGQEIADAIQHEAEDIIREAAEDHERLATLGLAELPTPEDRPLQILTHCNTGPLACGQFGTALGVVQVAVHQGRQVHVFVDETRPYLQGARLTAWELGQAGVGHTLIADSAAGWVFTKYAVDAVLVGADRIAANGDTANKIGTYPLAVMARRHGIPLYVCAPLASVDPTTADGSGIMIELREGSEVTSIRGLPIAPAETPAINPAFDVTPNDLITAIVTEAGVFRAPFGSQLADAVAAATAARAARAAITGAVAASVLAPAPAPTMDVPA
jgi:methylthioribose-1-phosphate isomerase